MMVIAINNAAHYVRWSRAEAGKQGGLGSCTTRRVIALIAPDFAESQRPGKGPRRHVRRQWGLTLRKA
jgi:hypothetical protein